MININRLVQVNIEVEKVSEKYVFQLVLQEGVNFLFKVKKEEERSSWIESIVRQVNKLRENQSVALYNDKIFLSLDALKESKIYLYNKSSTLTGMLSLAASRSKLFKCQNNKFRKGT